MHENVRKNLKASIGDIVHISPAGFIPYLSKIHVLPFKDTLKGFTGDIVKTHLIPYFINQYRTVKRRDCFTATGQSKTI